MIKSTGFRALAASIVVVALAACSSDPAAVTERKLKRAFGDDAKGIEVTVEGSTATLSGTAEKRATQELAEEVAMSVPGITAVRNLISAPEARGLGKLRDEALDAALEIAVKSAIVRDAGSDLARALEIEACDGVVSLRGTLAGRDSARRVVEVASAVDGVRRVIDLVSVAR